MGLTIHLAKLSTTTIEQVNNTDRMNCIGQSGSEEEPKRWVTAQRGSVERVDLTG